jgi:hypothetical protein
MVSGSGSRNREFPFPDHSLFDPCSESSQKPSFTRQRALQQGLTSQGPHLKAQYSLYFSLLAGNSGREEFARDCVLRHPVSLFLSLSGDLFEISILPPIMRECRT